VCLATRWFSIGFLTFFLLAIESSRAQSGADVKELPQEPQLQYTVSPVVRGKNPPKPGFIQMRLKSAKAPYTVHMSAKVKVGSMLVLNGDNANALVSEGLIEKDIALSKNRLSVPVQHLSPNGDVSEYLIVMEVIEPKPRVRPAPEPEKPPEKEKKEEKPEEKKEKAAEDQSLKKKQKKVQKKKEPKHVLNFEDYDGHIGLDLSSTYLLSNSTPQKTASLFMGGVGGFWAPHINHGLDFRYKQKLIGSGEGANLAPTSLEARYYFRMHWNGFFGLGFVKGFELAPALGYETYTNNQSTANFVKGYSLIKYGFKLEFLLWEQWTTGGEVFYGKASTETKTEMAGWLQYAVWYPISIGGGYHLHLVETTNPTALNTREGYGDLFGYLRYNF
jgi:hypothetical protein